MRRCLSILAVASVIWACTPRDGSHTLHVLTTGDVHGAWFDSTWNGASRTSLMSVDYYVDSIRTAVGKDNVILLDAGDCLQGDNAAYYYSYVDPVRPHLFARIASYMGYDAVVVGNHDIEAGPELYNRLKKELGKQGIPFMAANCIRQGSGTPHFPAYRIYRKAGMKVAVIGFTNANIKEWLGERYWKGLDFQSITEVAQGWVDRVRHNEKPDVVIVLTHSGSGKGDGSEYQNQGLDLFAGLRGVDFVISAHDHQPMTAESGSIHLINGGSHASGIGHGEITVTFGDGNIIGKELSSGIIRVDPARVSQDMKETFRPEFETVKAFSMKEICSREDSMLTRESYMGPCEYMDLLHSVSMDCPEARLSFCAPLTFNGTIPAGPVRYNDLFTIYPYENQLSVVNMKGSEILSYLEYSYDKWINTVTGAPGEHLLKIRQRPDERYGRENWSFVYPPFNFDSCGGLNYSVDITAPFGKRITVSSLADGSVFEPDTMYGVAMTSYRAAGGGLLMEKGAGLTPSQVEERTIARYPAIRDILYGYLVLGPEYGRPVGRWSFVPEGLASDMLASDMSLLFD